MTYCLESRLYRNLFESIIIMIIINNRDVYCSNKSLCIFVYWFILKKLLLHSQTWRACNSPPAPHFRHVSLWQCTVYEIAKSPLQMEAVRQRPQNLFSQKIVILKMKLIKSINTQIERKFLINDFLSRLVNEKNVLPWLKNWNNPRLVIETI